MTILFSDTLCYTPVIITSLGWRRVSIAYPERSRPMESNLWNEEAPLAELLADPIAKLVMQRDQTSEQAIRDALYRVRRRPDRPKPRRSSGIGAALRGVPGILCASARRHLRIIHAVATDRRVPWLARLPSLAALAYLLSPIDLIPDWIPGIGFMDDTLVVVAASLLTLRLVPRDLVAEYGGAAPASASRARAGARAAAPDHRDRADFDSRILYWMIIGAGIAVTATALVALMAMNEP
jgi:uncharacterized membrane protein YkvA (DUF1232 family)